MGSIVAGIILFGAQAAIAAVGVRNIRLLRIKIGTFWERATGGTAPSDAEAAELERRARVAGLYEEADLLYKYRMNDPAYAWMKRS